MNDYLNTDDFLARWLAGELSEEELSLFQKHPDFSKYQRLADASSQLIIPSIDTDQLLSKIKARQKTSNNKPKPTSSISRRLFLPSAIAATILLLIIGYIAWDNDTELIFSTSIGEQLAHTLPDGSSILLNANSEIKYLEKSFADNRQIQLEGEAFFEVIKGNTFVVETQNGKVEVLGTSFSVYSRSDDLVSKCKTGSVKVSNRNKEAIILKQGEKTTISNQILGEKTKISITTIGSWQKGVSSFESESLDIVRRAIEDQFGISIQLDIALKEEKFTGSFLHKDIETAMKMVFTPMGLHYKKDKNGNFKIIK